MSTTVRYGLVGCGHIAAMHVKAAERCDKAVIAAVTDLDEARAKSFADEHHIPHVYPSAEAMFADGDLDAVVLAIPVKGRTALALQAIAAGKHVLVEKPAGMNFAEVQSIVEAAETAGKLAASCSSRHSGLPTARAAAAVVASERLGALRVVRGRAVGAAPEKPNPSPPIWRVRFDLNAGGILSNWGVYDLDYLLSVCGWQLKPINALAQVWPVAEQYSKYVHPDSNAETHAAALIRCESGAVITLERGEFLPVETQQAWEIVGERASLQMNLLPGGGERVHLYEANANGEGVRHEVIHDGEESWPDAHDFPLQDLTDAILNHREPASSLTRARTITAIADAIYASAKSGKCEPVPTA